VNPLSAGPKKKKSFDASTPMARSDPHRTVMTLLLDRLTPGCKQNAVNPKQQPSLGNSTQARRAFILHCDIVRATTPKGYLDHELRLLRAF
jgi:hypothetical protein